jgi:trigger factor
VVGTSEIQKLEHSAVKLTIKMTKDEVRSEYDKHLKELLKDAQLPGFRRGKVPQAVLEKKAGPSLKEDVLNQIVGETVNGLLKSDTIPKESLPLADSDPQVDGEPKLDLDSDLEFSVIYDVMPQVAIEKWEGFEAEVDEAEVTDEDIGRELEKIRDRNAVVMDRNDDAPAQKGDVVTVDYRELDEAGAVLPDSEREDFVWTLGDGKNVYKIDDEITGMKKNEIKDFEKKYPEDFEDKELAGTTKRLRATLKAVKEKKLPDLDDELAQDVSEKFKTLDDLKKNIQERLETRLVDGLKAMKQAAVLKKIIEANPIDLPESLVKAELGNNVRRMFGNYQLSEAELDRFLETNSNFAELWRPQAEENLKGQLLVAELLKQQTIEISEAEREQEIENYAKNAGTTTEEVKKVIENNPDALPLDGAIRERKLFALIESKNQVKKGKKVKYLDLFPDYA